MLFLRLGGYYFVIIVLVLTSITVAMIPTCIDISTLDTYRHGYRYECYGNCKYAISSVMAVLLCFKECLLFNFCTAVNYNRDTLECELLHIQGTLQSEMVMADAKWEVVNAIDIQQDIVGVCLNHNCQFSQKCVELKSGAQTCVNHGLQLAPGLYGPLLPNTRLLHPQDNNTLTIYECKALTDPVATESQPVSMIVGGVYTTANVSCSAADCFNSSVSYAGLVTVTVNGIPCQRWDSSTPHAPNYLIGRSDLNNWCRLPDGEPRPWCYTTDPNKRWEFCPIMDCL